MPIVFSRLIYQRPDPSQTLETYNGSHISRNRCVLVPALINEDQCAVPFSGFYCSVRHLETHNKQKQEFLRCFGGHATVFCSPVLWGCLFIHTFVDHADVCHPNRLLQQMKGSTTGSFLSFAPHVWQVQDSDITCTFQMWSVIYMQALAPTGIRPAAEFSSSIISEWSMACLLLWSVYLFLGEKWTQSRNNSVV